MGALSVNKERKTLDYCMTYIDYPSTQDDKVQTNTEEATSTSTTFITAVLSNLFRISSSLV